MVRPRFVSASVLVSRLSCSCLFVGLGLGLAPGVAGCGGDKPPPRSAGNVEAPRGHQAPTGGSSTSLSDSALEPAVADALKSEDWPRAEALARELARRQPRNPAGKHGLGVALSRQDKNTDAVTALEESLQIADDVRTRLDLAAAFAALGRYPSALPHLRKAVKMAPADPAGWTQLATALLKVEKPDGAADVLGASGKECSACADDADWGHVADQVAEALAAKAEKQLGSNDAAGARKNADAAVALRPNSPATHLLRGKLARAGGDTKTATTEYRKAIDGLPDAKAEAGTGARLELADLLTADGKGAEAAKLAGEVVAARGDHGPALDTLGRACDAAHDVKGARNAYDKLTRLPPGAASREALEHARRRMKELKGPKGRRR